MTNALGAQLANTLRDRSLELYTTGRAMAATRGLIIADTKFEFGMVDGAPILIDEVLTPDSSRFWPADTYAPGKSQPSFDKQPLRDYLADLKKQGAWNGDPPPPPLPAAVVAATSSRYLDAYQRITGQPLPGTA
jgi:phosphoribosylaminoimidazole-succinocarboxamide synthase